MKGSDFLAAARSYAGIPFYHAGRTRNGLDCVGLLLVAARDAFGLTYQPGGYPADWVDPIRLAEEIERFCDSVEWGDIEDGDIGLFSIAGNAQHVAILSRSGGMIHAYQSAGKVVEHPLDHHWRKRLVRVYRVRGA